jgi:hypothetical protein
MWPLDPTGVNPMKAYTVAAALVLILAIAGACTARSTSEPDLEATVQAAVQATLDAQPTETPAPDIQATMVAAVEATVAAHLTASAAQQKALGEPTSPSSDALAAASASERPNRSYPAPTGYPGFRKYYQKRCYPGCHYDATEGTPTPEVVHP